MSSPYHVILADPPWSYSNSGTRGAALNEYKTMTIDDICALPVQTVAADDCILLLWATNPLIPEALKVCNAWGFKYVTSFPWVKLSSPPQINFFGDGILSENFFHSRKPENIYEYAESMSGPYLEMFARRQRQGWDVFGNEVEGSIRLLTTA